MTMMLMRLRESVNPSLRLLKRAKMFQIHNFFRLPLFVKRRVYTSCGPVWAAHIIGLAAMNKALQDQRGA